MANKKNNSKDFSNKGRNNCRNRGAKNGRGKYGKYEESTTEELRGKTEARNDSGWYQADSVLMKDAANLPFPNATGMPLQITDPACNVGIIATDKYTLPGIMRVNVITTPGTMGTWNDPVNVAVRDIYSFVRHQNSGSKNYDAADLGVYFYAYDSCATFYAYLVRLYGTVRTVLVRNRYTPEDLISVMGANYRDIADHLAQLRSYINTFAARLSALKVPSSLHFIERHMWLFSHIFADSRTDKCQMYVVNPAAFWEYKVGTTPADTYFHLSEKVPMVGELYTFERLTTFGNALLNSVLNSEDFNIMSGDILKAYGDKTFVLNMITEEYAVSVVYEPEFLLQLHNATVFHCEHMDNDSWNLYSNWKIFQDYSETPNVGALMCNFDIPLSGQQYTNVSTGSQLLTTGLARPLDLPIENPDSTTVAIATRMAACAIFTSNAKGEKVMQPYAFGTELVVGCWIFIKDAATRALSRTPMSLGMTGDRQWTFSTLPVYITAGSADLSTGSLSSAPIIVGSLDNITMVPSSILYNIHRAALLGMYGLAK